MSWFKKEKEREYWLLASVGLNLFLSLLKLYWGWKFSSIVVTADGIHSISDVFGAFFVFIALRFAGHKSKQFPFGLNKLEDLAALLGGTAIIFAGYGIIHSTFFDTGIRKPENILGTVIFIIIIILLETVFFLFERKAAIRLKSPGVKTDAVNWLGDIGASLVVLAGVIGYRFSIPYTEKVAVIVIVIMVFYGAYGIIRDALLSLLEASVDKETIKKAIAIINRQPEVTKIDKLFIRRSGSILIADIVLQIKQKSMQGAHHQIDTIENQLRDEINNLAHVTIHYEPEKKLFSKTAVLLAENKEDIATSFSETKWIKILQFDEKGILRNEEIIPNPVNPEQKGKAIRLAAWLIKQDIQNVIFDPEDLRDDIKTLFSALGIEIKKNLQDTQNTINNS